MALSSNSKKGLALGALLPVLLSVYSESRKQAEAHQQQQTAQLQADQTRREGEQARDLDSAQKFLAQVTGDGNDPADARHDGSFCDHVYIASELVRLSRYSTATQAALIGVLQYRAEPPPQKSARSEATPARPQICQCPVTLEQIQLNWRPGKKSTLAGTAVIEDMASALDGVAAKCSDDDAVTTPPPAAPEVVGSVMPPSTGDDDAGGSGAAAEPPAAGQSAAPQASAAPAACTAAPSAQSSPARVYIQIAREDQRGIAQHLQGALREEGYIAPGIERVGNGAAPSRMQLRYVYAEDCAAAQALLDRVQSAVAPAALELAPPLIRYRGRSLHRNFEVWFPK